MSRKQMETVVPRRKFKDRWDRIAWEYFYAPGTMGNFHFQLCELIQHADLMNTARLSKGFPELVQYIKVGVDE